jgi:hypothetical protein
LREQLEAFVRFRGAAVQHAQRADEAFVLFGTW